MQNIRLAWKLPVAIVLFVIIGAAVTAIVSYEQAREALRTESGNKLVALRDARKQAISDYFATIRDDLLVMSDNETVRDAMIAFTVAGRALGEDPRDYLQKHYIVDNANKVGEKHHLDAANDGSDYTKRHEQYHPWFRKFLEARGYYDIFLISPEGTVVYTVFKERDFATNVRAGEFKDSDLGKAFDMSSNGSRKGRVSFLDFRPYAPSGGAAASFISTPIIDPDGKVLGVLVFQMPIDRINRVMQVSAGMGESGETYLVGKDMLMRSDSRFTEDSSILKTQVNTGTVRAALAGQAGVDVTPDYRGVPVLSAYDSLLFEGVTMAVMAEIDESEVDQPVLVMRLYIFAGAVLVVIVTGFFAFLLALTLSRPITGMTTVMNGLAGGNLAVEVSGIDRKDEIGEMARAVQVFHQNAVKIRDMEEVTDNIISSITATTSQVAASVTEQAAASSEQAAAVSQTTTSLEEIRETADTTMSHVDGMRSSAEQTLSQGEIGRQQMETVVDAMSDIRDKVEAIAHTMMVLSEQTRRVGEITDTVSTLAQQSKMLAINASIEAAKAGEAGKGFSVVAEEVANLAEQSEQATQQVRGVLTQIQAASEKAIFATEEGTKQVDLGVNLIERVGEQMNSLLSVISDTVSATRRMVDSIRQQTSGIQQVTGAMNDIVQGSTQIAASTGQIRAALDGLAGEVERLNRVRST